MSASPWTPDALRRIRARDPEALNAFFEAYFDRAYAYVCRLVGDPHTAEDLTQVAFLKMHRSIHTLDTGRDPASWVFAVVANTVRDHWRSRGRRDESRRVVLRPETHTEAPTAQDDLEARDAARVLGRALAALSENLRAVVLLRDGEGLDYPDIAGILGLSEAAVRKRHSRALIELKRALDTMDTPAPLEHKR